jgi:hypothetical protein
MTITEAHAVNDVLDWITSGRSAMNGGPISDDEAREALSTLAASAHRQLMAGADRADVTQRWPRRRFRSDVLGRRPQPRGVRT